MSKFNVEFESSDFIDVVEESYDKIIIQANEGSVTVDRKTFEFIHGKAEEILFDETFKQMEEKYLDALNLIDKLKQENYDLQCAAEKEHLNDWNSVANF